MPWGERAGLPLSRDDKLLRTSGVVGALVVVGIVLWRGVVTDAFGPTFGDAHVMLVICAFAAIVGYVGGMFVLAALSVVYRVLRRLFEGVSPESVRRRRRTPCHGQVEIHGKCRDMPAVRADPHQQLHGALARVAQANVTRPCAFIFLRASSRVLVCEMTDEVEGVFYRPPGGGIEFGEHSREAATRELHEEFNLEMDPDALSLIGVVENAFEFRGAPHHEICFIYEARVADNVLDRLDGQAVMEVAPVGAEVARVFDLEELRNIEPLYPDDVKALLRG